MSSLKPYFLQNVKNYIDKGYNLNQIITEYMNNNNYAEFLQEIKVAYFHLKKGPDLRDYQSQVVDEAIQYFGSNTRLNYKLFWCCGLGKTKTSLSITKHMNSKSILIGVPNILLLDQFVEDLNVFFPLSKIYKLYSKSDLTSANQTQRPLFEGNLSKYLNSDYRYKIVVTTYHSSEKISKILNTIDFVFDMIILDECHHLQTKKQKQFYHILEIPFKSRLLLSATPYIGEETTKLHSFAESQQFQGIDNTKSIAWGIKNGYITNYKIMVLNVQNDEITIPSLKRYDNNMVLAAFMALKCIFDKYSKKMIIYCNKVENSKIVRKIINELLTDHINLFNSDIDIDNIGNYELNGTDKMNHRKETLVEFTKKKYGIMSSVQLFGEGFDYPELDSVLFAEKMTSDIRIVQASLRPCRKDSSDPTKVAKILLPIFRDDLNKVKQVLLNMKSVDQLIDKIEVVQCKQITDIKFRRQQKPKLHYNLINSELLEKIELEFLDTELKSIEINNTNNISINYTNQTKVILCPVSDHSFKNYYRSIYSSELDNCYWGLKSGQNEKQWVKLDINDYIVLVEKAMITIGKISELNKNKKMSEKLWGSDNYELLIKFILIKRIPFNKTDFMTNIGYKSTDNLMGCRIYRDLPEKIISQFEC
jgi:superfamily II DNA or RNA helicase